MNPTLIAYTLAGFLGWSILLGGSAFYKGSEYQKTKQQATQGKHTEQVLDQRVKNEVKSNESTTQTIKEVEVIKWKTKEVIKNVPVYITKTADSKCVIPNGFVSLHDSSASGEGFKSDPATTSLLYDSPSEVKLSEVGETVAENYGTYHQEMKRFTGLQSWVQTYCK